MRSYAKSKDVHKALKTLLGGWFSENGWRKRPGYTCAFLRDDWVFWVQPSQWGNSWSGNSFTLNLCQSPSAELGAGIRILWALDSSDREVGLELESKIVTRIPRPASDHEIYDLMKLPGFQGQMFRDSFESTFKPNPIGWEPDRDIWLRYFAIDDVAEWSEFLIPRLQHLTQEASGGA